MGCMQAAKERGPLIRRGGIKCPSCCDSSAARGVLTRVGSGRIRHLEVKHLWVQELVTRKVLRIEWIPRTRNPADVLTHSTSQIEFWRLLGLLGIRVTDRP